MVNYLVERTANALASTPRIVIIDELAQGSRTTSELAVATGLRLNALAKHLDVLRDAQLVRSTKNGRTVTHTLSPAPLDEIGDWVRTRTTFWHNQLDALAQSLEETP